MDTTTSHFADLLFSEQNYRRNTLNLNASENYTSPLVGNIQGNHAVRDNYHFDPPSCVRVNDNEVGHWTFSQLSMIEQVRTVIEDCFEELLGTCCVDPRPKGGQTAEIATLRGLGGRGDIFFVVEEADGGHFGLSEMAKDWGIHLEPIAFDQTNHVIDIEETLRRMREVEGSLGARRAGGRVAGVQLAQSYVLREQPLRDFALRVRDEFPGAKLAVDISHTMALHMGEKLAQPIACGFDIVHGNTHKTFPGPQKAIIGFSPECDSGDGPPYNGQCLPVLQSNCGSSEIFALGVAALEMRRHRHEYASKIVENAQVLARALANESFRVVGEAFGFSETHQVWLLGSGEKALKEDYCRLVASGIRANPAVLPFSGGRWGLRIGTQGITRRGMEPSDMRDIAWLLKRALLDRDDPERIRVDAYAVMSNFPLSEVRFRLTPEEERQLSRFAHIDVNPALEVLS